MWEGNPRTRYHITTPSQQPLIEPLDIKHINTYFEGRGESDPSPFTPNSNWTPPLMELPEKIKKIKEDYENFHAKFKCSFPKPNLTKAEFEALIHYAQIDPL